MYVCVVGNQEYLAKWALKWMLMMCGISIFCTPATKKELRKVLLQGSSYLDYFVRAARCREI